MQASSHERDLRWFDCQIMFAEHKFQLLKENWELNNGLRTDSQFYFIQSLLDSTPLTKEERLDFLVRSNSCHVEVAEELINELQVLKSERLNVKPNIQAFKSKKIDLCGMKANIEMESLNDFFFVKEQLNRDLILLEELEFKYMRFTSINKPFYYDLKQVKNVVFEGEISKNRSFKNAMQCKVYFN